MSLTSCRDCSQPIMFCGKVPYDFVEHRCRCGIVVRIATVNHFRTCKHQNRRSTRASKPDTKSRGMSTPVYGKATSQDDQARLNALIAEKLIEEAQK